MDSLLLSPKAHPGLSTAEVVIATREAKKEGIFAGLTSGLLGGLIGNRLFGFNRNKTLFSGMLTGVLAGYFFTQAFLSTHLAEAAAHRRLLERDNGSPAQADDAAGTTDS